jgi:opacity protein-like surface antigen
MIIKNKLNYLFLLLLVSAPSVVAAGVYAGLATSFLNIKTNAGSTTPMTADISLGYSHEVHHIELVVMSGIKDDNLNQLVTDVPVATSLLYRFTANPRNSLHINLILGYSQVEIESSYVDVPKFSETFSGVSWGVGLEEALESIPQLIVKADFIQLYRGDDLKINSFNVGIRYEF